MSYINAPRGRQSHRPITDRIAEVDGTPMENLQRSNYRYEPLTFYDRFVLLWMCPQWSPHAVARCYADDGNQLIAIHSARTAYAVNRAAGLRLTAQQVPAYLTICRWDARCTAGRPA